MLVGVLLSMAIISGLFLTGSGHTLMLLIALEGMVLVAFTGVSLTSGASMMSVVTGVGILVLSSSSAAFGLSLLVVLCRSHGKDALTGLCLAW